MYFRSEIDRAILRGTVVPFWFSGCPYEGIGTGLCLSPFILRLCCGNGSGRWQMFLTRSPPLYSFRPLNLHRRLVFNHSAGTTFMPPAETSAWIFRSPSIRTAAREQRDQGRSDFDRRGRDLRNSPTFLLYTNSSFSCFSRRAKRSIAVLCSGPR